MRPPARGCGLCRKLLRPPHPLLHGVTLRPPRPAPPRPAPPRPARCRGARTWVYSLGSAAASPKMAPWLIPSKTPTSTTRSSSSAYAAPPAPCCAGPALGVSRTNARSSCRGPGAVGAASRSGLVRAAGRVARRGPPNTAGRARSSAPAAVQSERAKLARRPALGACGLPRHVRASRACGEARPARGGAPAAPPAWPRRSRRSP
jgi:hypothetical protein